MSLLSRLLSSAVILFLVAGREVVVQGEEEVGQKEGSLRPLFVTGQVRMHAVIVMICLGPRQDTSACDCVLLVEISRLLSGCKCL
mmetsp:Transcript_104820/g.168774  ORF Transcript_104820/g.168774 Transcript_104820/m.168774 type:complete len:85 (-) Transcript_104820:140-394(-)